MGKKKGIKITGYIKMTRDQVVEIGGQPDTGGVQFFGATKTHFGITQGYNTFDVNFDIYGKNFGYMFPGQPPTSGTIRTVEVRKDGSLLLVVEQLKLPALKAIKLFQRDDPIAAFKTLLKGNDTIIGSPSDDELWGGKGNDRLFGNDGRDVLDGFKGNDLLDGGPGNDRLNDTKGKNVFQFSSSFQEGEANRSFNFDTIEKLRPVDRVYFSYDYFGAAGMKVSKGELAFSPQALDANDFFLWDKATRTFFYDPDANGPTPATPIFQTLNNAKLTHKMIEIGVLDY